MFQKHGIIALDFFHANREIQRRVKCDKVQGADLFCDSKQIHLHSKWLIYLVIKHEREKPLHKKSLREKKTVTIKVSFGNKIAIAIKITMLRETAVYFYLHFI